MNVRESWVRATERLALTGVADASLEAEVLHRHALEADRAQFFATLHEPLAPSHQRQVDRSVRRRAGGEPLAYIIGRREFYGLDLFVNADVLVPRQETELLVDRVLEVAASHPECKRIADVGTGSGAIAVAVARHLPDATVYATDSSEEALRVADLNRRTHGVAERVDFLHGDLLQPLPTPVDIIVSNPPYLSTGELSGLAPEVRREPASALDGGADGLRTIRRLLRQAPHHIRPDGCILIEIAPQQLDAVTGIAGEAFPSAHVSFARDLLGLPRVVSVQLSRP